MLYASARGMGHLVSGEEGPAALLWGGRNRKQPTAHLLPPVGAAARCCAVAAGTSGGAQAQLERGGQQGGWGSGPLTVRKGGGAVCRPYSPPVNTDL